MFNDCIRLDQTLVEAAQRYPQRPSVTLLADHFRDWNIEQYLADISCPVLLLQGDRDEYGTLAQLSAIQRKDTRSCHPALPDRLRTLAAS